MRLDEAGMDAYTDRFDHDALRVETRSSYDVASDGGEVARYLAGEPAPDPSVVGPWHGWIRAQVARGTTVRRLRVLHAPPGDYLRYECEWGYVGNTAAGEDIRILDLTERPRPDGFLEDELWMLDQERVALMRYDDAGRFSHADTAEGDAATPWRESCAAAWRAAEPFTAWWAAHPQYRRAAGCVGA